MSTMTQESKWRRYWTEAAARWIARQDFVRARLAMRMAEAEVG